MNFVWCIDITVGFYKINGGEVETSTRRCIMWYSNIEIFHTLNSETSKIILIVGEDFNPKDSDRVLNLHWNSVVAFAHAQEIQTKMNRLSQYRQCIQIRPEEMNQFKNCMNKKTLKIINAKRDEDTTDKDYRKTLIHLFDELKRLVGYEGFVFVDGIDEAFASDISLRFDEKRIFFFNNCLDDADYSVYNENIESTFSDFFNEVDNNQEDDFQADTEKQYTGIFINGKYCKIPNQELINTDYFAELLSIDDTDSNIVPSFLTEPIFYNAINRCQNVGVRTIEGDESWVAYSNDLTFPRTVEKDIYKRIKRNLDYPSKNNAFCIFGQSFSGKTVLIKRVVYKILKEMQYPVIILRPSADFSSEEVFNQNSKQIKKRNKSLNAIVNLMSLLKKNGANSVLLVWDISAYYVDSQKYSSLFKSLENCGLPFTMLCSTYINVSDKGGFERFKWFELKEELDYDEKEDLRKLLVEKANMRKDYCKDLLQNAKGSLLKLIYLISKEVQPKIISGIFRETSVTINEVLDLLSGHYEYTRLVDTQFSRAFQKIGYVCDIEEKKSIDADTLSLLVAFCSKLRIGVPTSLLLRSVRITEVDDILKLMSIPVFVFSYDENNNTICFFRSQFEAELYFEKQKKMCHEQGKAVAEIYEKAFRKLIEEFEPDNENEVLAIRDFLMRINPNSADNRIQNEFLPFYDTFISVMLEEDNLYKIKNSPKIALQLVTLIREYYYNYLVFKQNNYTTENLDKSEAMLKQAVAFAKEVVRSQKANLDRQITNKLNCEICLCMLESKNRDDSNPEYFFDIQTSAINDMLNKMYAAIQSEPSNSYYYTCWESIAYNYLTKNNANFEEIGKILAELNRFKEISALNTNRHFLNKTDAIERVVLNDDNTSHLENEIKKGNTAACFVKALMEIKQLLHTTTLSSVEHLDDMEVDSLSRIVQMYLPETNRNPECMQLRLSIKQCMYNRGGWKPFDRESTNKGRGTLCISNNQWEDLYNDSKDFYNSLIKNNEEQEKAKYLNEMYTYAISSAHYHLIKKNNEIINESDAPIRTLRNITYFSDYYIGGRRKEIRQLICNTNGQPISFIGTVKSVQNGDCRVEFAAPINRLIPTHSKNIDGEETKQGYQFPFVIGLSYMGFTCIKADRLYNQEIKPFEGGM